MGMLFNEIYNGIRIIKYIKRPKIRNAGEYFNVAQHNSGYSTLFT